MCLQGRGSTCVLVAVQQVLVGVVAVMDPIKPEARWGSREAGRHPPTLQAAVCGRP